MVLIKLKKTFIFFGRSFLLLLRALSGVRILDRLGRGLLSLVVIRLLHEPFRNGIEHSDVRFSPVHGMPSDSIQSKDQGDFGASPMLITPI